MEACAQMSLGLRVNAPAREAAQEDARTLMALLEGRPEMCRVPAAQVCEALTWNDRRLRAAAEASDGEVLSAPGCVGYRLARMTPVEDYLVTERARYRSQIREMSGRLCRMDRAVYGRSKKQGA